METFKMDPSIYISCGTSEQELLVKLMHVTYMDLIATKYSNNTSSIRAKYDKQAAAMWILDMSDEDFGFEYVCTALQLSSSTQQIFIKLAKEILPDYSSEATTS